MANYIDIDDMVLYCDSKLLVKLTNDDETVNPNLQASIDEDVLDRIILYCSSIMANYLRHIYNDVEPTDVPTEDLKGICADLVIARLWQRRGAMPEAIKMLKEEATERLHKMATAKSEQIRKPTQKSTSKQPSSRE